jgi:hypothetical protein
LWRFITFDDVDEGVFEDTADANDMVRQLRRPPLRRQLRPEFPEIIRCQV